MNQLVDIIKQHKNTINTLNFQIKQNKGVTDNIINEKKKSNKNNLPDIFYCVIVIFDFINAS